MPITVDPRILNLAGYIAPLSPMGPTSNSVVVAWYGSSGAMRATVYADAPGYVFPQQQSSITNARDFLYTFITQTTSFSRNGAARSAWDVFNGQISAYQSAVVDYVNSGAGAEWRPPFPQTIASMWRNLLTAYLAAWSAARALAAETLAAASGGAVATNSIPTVNTVAAKTVSPAAQPVAGAGFMPQAPTFVASMPPEVQAQVTGTQRVGVNPQATLSTTSNTSPSQTSAGNAQQASQTMAAAGDPVQVPSSAIGEDALRQVVHTPLYKETSFWVAVGAGTVLVGMGYWFFFRKGGR